MKTKINFLITFLFFSALSDLNAQNYFFDVCDLIEQGPYSIAISGDKNLSLNRHYNNGAKRNPNVSDCIMFGTNISNDFLQKVKTEKMKYLATIAWYVNFLAPESTFSVRIIWIDNKFKVQVGRTNADFKTNGTPVDIWYTIDDILLVDGIGLPGTKLTFLLSSTNAMFFSDVQGVMEDKDSIEFRAAPLFFGLDSDDLTVVNESNTSILINAKSQFVDPIVVNSNDQVLTIYYPTKNFNEISSELFGSKYTDNIVNARMSGSTEGKTLSLNNPATVSTLKLYPNPSNGQFSIDFPMNQAGNVSFEIVDIKGQKVFEQKEQQFAQGSATHVLDTKGTLTSGIYILKVTAPDFSETTRLIVK